MGMFRLTSKLILENSEAEITALTNLKTWIILPESQKDLHYWKKSFYSMKKNFLSSEVLNIQPTELLVKSE